MDLLTFISQMISALAWPAAVLVLVFAMRKPVSEALSILRKLRFRDLELEFDRQVTELKQTAAAGLMRGEEEEPQRQLREQLMRLASASPEAAVVEAWRHVENRLVDLARARAFDAAPATWVMPLVLGALMMGKNLINEPQYATLRSLKHLRDQVTHGRGIQITASEALEYIDVAVWLVASLK